MLDYRLYFLNGRGLIANAAVLKCADDTEALEATSAQGSSGDVELWQGERLVKLYPCSPLVRGLAQGA
jgi:hypothetical protein